MVSNYDETVFNTGVNVVVMFHAPWCGHCKSLSPHFERVGKFFKAEERVIVAKVDAANNDMPHSHKITGYPTLSLFPRTLPKAGEPPFTPEQRRKRDMMTFSGERKSDDIIDWVLENAVGITGTPSPGGERDEL